MIEKAQRKLSWKERKQNNIKIKDRRFEYMLQDKTIGIILTLKNSYSNDNDYKEELLKFLCDFTITDYNYISKLDEKIKYNIILENLTKAFANYIGNANDSEYELIKFFSYKYDTKDTIDDVEAIRRIFVESRVYDFTDLEKGVLFINGFRNFEFKNLKLDLNSKL